VLVEFAPDAGIGLSEFVALQRELGELLGREVDVHTAESFAGDRLVGYAVVHDYADVHLVLGWKTVREDLPGQVERLNAILGEGAAS